MFFTISDIFLFIYFLHYITQSVKYEVIIRRISDNTLEVMTANCLKQEDTLSEITIENGTNVLSNKSGIYESYGTNNLIIFSINPNWDDGIKKNLLKA